MYPSASLCPPRWARGRRWPLAAPREVLVVDDSTAVRLLVRSMAEAHGFVVREAADGVEALALLVGRASRCVVLLDYSMPAMSGWGVLKAIAAENALAWHVYLMMTADRAPRPVEGT